MSGKEGSSKHRSRSQIKASSEHSCVEHAADYTGWTSRAGLLFARTGGHQPRYHRKRGVTLHREALNYYICNVIARGSATRGRHRPIGPTAKLVATAARLRRPCPASAISRVKTWRRLRLSREKGFRRIPMSQNTSTAEGHSSTWRSSTKSTATAASIVPELSCRWCAAERGNQGSARYVAS
jgi:hypothetical protein